MLKKLLAIAVPLLALAGLGFYMLGGGGHKATPPNTAPAAAAPVAHVWTGRSSRKIDTTFLRSGQQLTLIKVAFSGLNTPLSSVSYSFSLPRPARVPAWLNAPRWQFVNVDGRHWTAAVRQQIAGATLYVTVSGHGLPTRPLAAAILTLTVPAPDGKFSIAEAPSAPPSGHTFAEKKAVTHSKHHVKAKR